MKKRIISLLLTICIVLSLLPSTALAEDSRTYNINSGDIIIEDDENNPGKIKVSYNKTETDTNIDPKETITVIGSSQYHYFGVKTAKPVTVKMKDANIWRGLTNVYPYAVLIEGKDEKADVTMILEGENEFIGGTGKPGITVWKNRKLTIKGSGSVVSRGTDDRKAGNYITVAGIGGEQAVDCGIIVIESGKVTGLSGHSGPGIGGRNGTVIITGGDVTGIAKYDVTDKAESIGRGANDSSCQVIITGGTVSKEYYDINGYHDNNERKSGSAGIYPIDSTNLIVFGQLTLPTDLTIPKNKTLSLLDDFSNTSLVIPEGVTLYVDGKFVSQRTVTGGGKIMPASKRLAQNSKPSAPKVKSIGKNSVTLNEMSGGVNGVEYSKDGNKWQSSTEFGGLTPGTSYTFYARYKGNGIYKESGRSGGVNAVTTAVYSVKLEPNGGKIKDVKNISEYTFGVGATLPTADDISKNGYDFGGWYEKENFSGSPVTKISSSDKDNKIYYAKWNEKNGFAVKYNTNGGNGIADKSVSWNGKVLESIASPTRSGYSFAGWKCGNKDINANTKYSELAENDSVKNITLIANWTEKNGFAVKYNTNGGNGIADKSVSWNGKVLENITAPTKKGYNFAGWKCGNKDINANTKYSDLAENDGVKNITLTAIWIEKNGFSIKYNTNGGSGIADKSVSWNGKVLENIASPTRSGYSFAGWKYGNQDINANTKYSDLAENDGVKNITLIANWTEKNGFSVKYNTNGGSGIADKSVSWNGKVLENIASPTRTGYSFAGWKCGNKDINENTKYSDLAENDGVKNITLTANWTDIEAPTGKIEIDENNKWENFLNKITFGLFFNEPKTAAITASDNSGKSVKCEYLISDRELSLENLNNSKLVSYTSPIRIDDENKYVIYAKLTDTSGNVRYISSNGFTIDMTVPSILGVIDGKTYCSAQTVTVNDTYIDSVTVNGSPVTLDSNNQFTLSPADGEQTIEAIDKAGNSVKLSVRVNNDHIWDKGNTTTEPTCTTDGEVFFICLEDSAHTKIETIPALGHDLVHHEAKAPTCTEKGWNAYDTCTRCDYTTYNELPALGHDLVHHEAKAPTCTEKGWNAYDTCTRCDYTTYNEMPALGHDLVHHNAKAPTCTEKGWNAYDTCSRCDYTTYEELPALGHDLVHHDAKAPACTEKGWNAYDTCSRCDYTTYEELPALGHDLVNHDAKAPTCTEKGWNAYDTCTRCDYTTYNELPALGHDMENIPVKDATVKATGNTEYWHCKNCGKYFSDEDGKHEIELNDTIIPKLPPEIIEGRDQSVTEGSKTALTFVSNALCSEFISVEINGKTLDEKNYTVKNSELAPRLNSPSGEAAQAKAPLNEDDTIVTLTEDYISSLTTGTYRLGIVSNNGTATAYFTVKAKPAPEPAKPAAPSETPTKNSDTAKAAKENTASPSKKSSTKKENKTPKNKKSASKISPLTGNNDFTLWFSVLILTGAFAIFVMVRKRKLNS